MIRYTVTYTRKAVDVLAQLWLDAPDRSALAIAGDEIDRILRNDTPQKGVSIERGFRQLNVAPLVADFSVEEDDRIVTVWRIHHVGELTNGH
ncbi:MAG TPA: hypothetical protein VFW73_11175 [Lacipirellulaceae bacterium]|nr:hypothetical protein [Lacipirellulaceae bacterium]